MTGVFIGERRRLGEAQAHVCAYEHTGTDWFVDMEQNVFVISQGMARNASQE